jgi:hypothetical protein
MSCVHTYPGVGPTLFDTESGNQAILATAIKWEH